MLLDVSIIPIQPCWNVMLRQLIHNLTKFVQTNTYEQPLGVVHHAPPCRRPHPCGVLYLECFTNLNSDYSWSFPKVCGRARMISPHFQQVIGGYQRCVGRGFQNSLHQMFQTQQSKLSPEIAKMPLPTYLNCCAETLAAWTCTCSNWQSKQVDLSIATPLLTRLTFRCSDSNMAAGETEE